MKMLRIIVLSFIPLLLFATVTPTLGTVKNHVVNVQGVISVKTNRSATEALMFNPGTTFITSGDTITFTNIYCAPGATCAISSSGDKHTVSIVSDDFLKTINGNTTILFFCGFDPSSICSQILTQHGDSAPAVSVIVNATGQPSVFQYKGQFGNSLYLSSAFDPRGGPQVVQATVTAPAGTYHFFCAVHPWMQGRIIVTNNPSNDEQS